MAFDGLSEKLSAAFKRLRSKGKLSESDVKSVWHCWKRTLTIRLPRILPRR